MLNDVPLVLFHFQALALYSDGTACLYLGNRKVSKSERELIYKPYVEYLEKAYASLRSLEPSFHEGIADKRMVKGSLARQILMRLRGRRNQANFSQLSQ